MKLRLAIAAALATAVTVTTAAAQQSPQQPWIRDRRYGEGIGIRTGDLELHPGIAGEIGYDSNYFQRSPDEPPILDVLRLRITPSLSLSTLGPQRRLVGEEEGVPPAVNFRAGVSAAYNEFIPLKSQDASQVRDQRHIDAGANFNLDVLPQRPWGFDANGNFIRTVEPSNSVLLDLAFDRDTLDLGAGINWRPGGGLFEWRLGYDFGLTVFERQAFKRFNNVQHTIDTRGRWRFLPRTAFIYDASYGFITYTDPGATQNDGSHLAAQIGVNGLVTNHFALLAEGGWTQSYYTPNRVAAQNYDDFIAHAEFKWFILPQASLEPTAATVGLSSIALGYVRNYLDTYYNGWYRRDRGYATFEYFVGGNVLLSLSGGLSHYAYPGTPTQPGFQENRADAILFGEYRFSDSFAINTTLRYDADLTKARIPVGAGFDYLDFTRFQAWLGVRYFW